MELLLQKHRSRSSSACSLWGGGWQSTAVCPHPPVLLWDVMGSPAVSLHAFPWAFPEH